MTIQTFWNNKLFPSPCGVWVVSASNAYEDNFFLFPSPCGVWVVSPTASCADGAISFRPLAGCGLFQPKMMNDKETKMVSVPLRGVGCFRGEHPTIYKPICFRPLAGCGLFLMKAYKAFDRNMFPSPCGVWVVSRKHRKIYQHTTFPSPCGVLVVSVAVWNMKGGGRVSVPLRGVGCFRVQQG